MLFSLSTYWNIFVNFFVIKKILNVYISLTALIICLLSVCVQCFYQTLYIGIYVVNINVHYVPTEVQQIRFSFLTDV